MIEIRKSKSTATTRPKTSKDYIHPQTKQVTAEYEKKYPHKLSILKLERGGFVEV